MILQRRNYWQGWQRVMPIRWEPRHENPTGGVRSEFPFVNKGDRVRLKLKNERIVTEWLEGTVDYLWLGIEEGIRVEFDDGSSRTVYPDGIDHVELLVTL